MAKFYLNEFTIRGKDNTSIDTGDVAKLTNAKFIKSLSDSQVQYCWGKDNITFVKCSFDYKDLTDSCDVMMNELSKKIQELLPNVTVESNCELTYED